MHKLRKKQCWLFSCGISACNICAPPPCNQVHINHNKLAYKTGEQWVNINQEFLLDRKCCNIQSNNLPFGKIPIVVNVMIENFAIFNWNFVDSLLTFSIKQDFTSFRPWISWISVSLKTAILNYCITQYWYLSSVYHSILLSWITVSLNTDILV